MIVLNYRLVLASLMVLLAGCSNGDLVTSVAAKVPYCKTHRGVVAYGYMLGGTPGVPEPQYMVCGDGTMQQIEWANETPPPISLEKK